MLFYRSLFSTIFPFPSSIVFPNFQLHILQPLTHFFGSSNYFPALYNYFLILLCSMINLAYPIKREYSCFRHLNISYNIQFVYLLQYCFFYFVLLYTVYKPMHFIIQCCYPSLFCVK